MSFEIKWAADELTLRDDSSDEPQRVENDDDSIVQPSPRRRWLWGTLVAILIVVGVVTGVVIGSSPPVASSPTSASNEGNDESDPFSVTLSAEEIFLRSVSRKYGVEFDDKTSYQSKALKWVETFESLGFDGKIDEFRVLQRYALACIYYATNNVPNAYTQKNFKDHPLSGWLVETGWLVDDDECEWMGVRCDDEGAVVELNMRNNILSGTFPPEAAYLKSLRLLDLYNNQMYNPGAEYNDWLGELENLEYLFLGQTNFEYEGIPEAISKLTNLVELDLSYTLYFGEFDGSIFERLTKLESLELSGLSFNSAVPPELSSLPNLKSLYLVYSDIAGDLSFLTGQWPKLYELWLDNNPQLQGELPTEIGNIATLVSLSITNCGLYGPLPSGLGELTNMAQMYLYENALSGAIPSTLSNLKNLETLELHSNDFTGSMAQDICFNRYARLQVLTADCEGEVECSEYCCTCCGEDCSDSSNRRELI